MSKNYAFPWGVYIGDLIDNNDTIPLCLDSKQGGFCVLFDESSEQVANNFIENVALKLLEVLPIGQLVVDVFVFGKQRFLHLASLNSTELYDIAYSPSNASQKFNEIEELSLYRHHNLLSFESPTLSEYNQQSSIKEPYHLLLINLDDFPDEVTSAKRIKNFFDSAYEAGFYTIALGSYDVLRNKDKATQHILAQFPHLTIQNRNFQLTKELFEFADMLENFEFEYLNDNKDSIIKTLQSELNAQEEQGSEQDFLSVPIGTIGNEKLYFNLGLKSQNYSAFIAGRTGTGKSNLLNVIITEIAKNYTAKEVELYMMDYNEGGLEFNKFRNHPNCRKLFLNCNNPESAYAMLQEFNGYMSQRGELFTSRGVSSIEGYNAKYPNESVPYKVLIIDEVQEMFSRNWKSNSQFNELLVKLAKKGRKYGLHFILATQGLDSVEIERAVISQMALKISFRLSGDSEAYKIFRENREACSRVTKLDKYYFVCSDTQKSMVVAKADYLQEESIETGLDELRRDKGVVLTPEVIDSRMVNEESKIKTGNSKRKEYKPKVTSSSEQNMLDKVYKGSKT